MSDHVRVDGKFFAEGNQRFRFHGVTYGTFEPRDDGALFPRRGQMKADLAAMHDAGFTVVRTYTEPPDDLLELAADWGLKVLAGTFWPDWRYQLGASRRERQALEREALESVRRAARRLAGCECVLAVCLGNEIPSDVVRWVGEARVAHVVSELASTVREEDPDRLVTYANYPSSEYLPLTGLDFVTFNVFLERQEDLRRYLTRLHQVAGDVPLVLGELGLDAGSWGEAAQAAALDWQLGTALEQGVAGTCVFSWTDDWWVGGAPVDGWSFGLTRRDRRPRPALDVAQSWCGRGVADLRPKDAWPSLSVVICAYNAEATLNECLLHTCALEYPRLEVIVVDDGSSDATGAIVSRHPRARLVTQVHAGLSVARNTGRSAARGEVIAYLDADAFPVPEWPYFLALGLEEPRVAAAGGPNVVPVSDSSVAQMVARAPGGPVQVMLSGDRAEHIPGCNLAFRRAALDAIGGFDPVYMAAGDDVDVCWKLLDRGWEIAFHPAALVWHHRRASVRGYLRQQVGYGKADALVAARHPDRFNALGAARWRGRIYGPAASGPQRIYRGAFGTAAFQAVYRGQTSPLATWGDIGAPLAVALALTLPLGLISPALFVPGVVGLLALAVLAVDGAWRAAVPHARRWRAWERAGVGLLSCAQPVARAWGRTRAASIGLDGVAARPTFAGPARVYPGRVMALRTSAPRVEVASALIVTIRRAHFTVAPPTGWEDHDLSVNGSILVVGDVITSAYPTGAVQVRVRRRLRYAAAVVLAVAVAVAAVLDLRLSTIVVALAAIDMAIGGWRTGPRLRQVISRAAEATETSREQGAVRA
jgi:GT2 family glycosyltransferase